MKYFSLISKNKKQFLTVFSLLITFVATTQVSGISPYSRLGLGDLNNQTSSAYSGFGGENASLSDYNQINLSNPATFSGFTKHLPIFELDFASQFLTLETASSESSSINATKFSRMALAFPINKNLGISAGLLPFTTTRYDITSENTITNIGKVNYIFEGNGGLNKAYIGAGYSLINKDSTKLSIGINTSFLFGNIEKSRKVEYPDDDIALNSILSQKTHINGFNFDIGIHYSKMLKKNMRLSLGAVLTTGANLSATREELYATYSNTFDVETIRDTTNYISDNEGTISIPLAMTFAASLNVNENFDVFGQYKLQDWTQYKEDFSSVSLQDSLSNSTTISGGIRYTPSNYYDKNPYYQKIQYRIGVRYSKTAVRYNNTQINEFGTSFGLGLPIKASPNSKDYFRSVSMIHIGGEYGTRGTTENGLIKEKFTNIYLGITIMPQSKNKWFVKRKIN